MPDHFLSPLTSPVLNLYEDQLGELFKVAHAALESELEAQEESLAG